MWVMNKKILEREGCVNQHFALDIIVEMYLQKDRKLLNVFMNFQNPSDSTERKGLWDIIRIYGVGGRLLKRIRSFYKYGNS